MAQKIKTRKAASVSKRQAGKPVSSNEGGARAKRAAERREAILHAALEEFAASGFAAARLDDVAKRAGVAKGTIYLYFADKETLFRELIHMELTPVVGALIHAAQADVPVRLFTEQLIEVFVREVYETRRRDVIRLIITEGPRFPAIAEFYYREVVSRVLEAVRALMRRAIERGEIKSDVLLRFPQIIPSPAIVAIFWNGLFDRFEPIDVRALMRAHFDILFGSGRLS
ncbi:MAG: TetR/AcrR family transcriptional regulator [Pseudomonadota bacterium]